MHVAHQEILQRILTLELEPGTTFTEGALAEQLHLSKTPVREALLLIGADGLVYPQIGSGYRVAHITLKSARDVLRHWALLATHATTLAAENGLASDNLSVLLDVVAGKYRQVEGGSLYDDNTAFQLSMAVAARNEELMRDLQRVQLKVQRLLVLTAQGKQAPDFSQSRAEILHAVQRGDVEAATKAAVAHAEQVQSSVMEALLNSDALLSVNLG